MTFHVLRAVHILAVVVYLGGGLLMHLSVRRAIRLIPPGQSSIVGAEMGRDFTLISWLSLFAWGASGYWMLFLFGWGDVTSPLTLFISPDRLDTTRGRGLLVMIASWYLLMISALVITFLLRPRLAARLPSGADSNDVEIVSQQMMAAARWIDRLAIANLILATIGFLSGVLYR